MTDIEKNVKVAPLEHKARQAFQQENKDLDYLKPLLLLILIAQNTSASLLGRHITGVPKEELFDINTFVLVGECMKFTMSGILELYFSRGVEGFQNHIFRKPFYENLMLCVPAVLYFASNILLYEATPNLPVPTLQLVQQCKLGVAALMSFIFLNSTYSVKQVLCIIALILGEMISMMTFGADTHHQVVDKLNVNMSTGLFLMILHIILGVSAGVYIEYILKLNTQRDNNLMPPPSLWLRNFQLSFFSVLFAFINQHFVTKKNTPFLHGFTFLVWIQVMLFSVGGMLVAAVIRYADNVIKGIAVAVSVVFSTYLSAIFFGTLITVPYIFGAVIVLSASYFFSYPFPVTLSPFLSPRTFLLACLIFPIGMAYYFLAGKNQHNSLLK